MVLPQELNIFYFSKGKDRSAEIMEAAGRIIMQGLDLAICIRLPIFILYALIIFFHGSVSASQRGRVRDSTAVIRRGRVKDSRGNQTRLSEGHRGNKTFPLCSMRKLTPIQSTDCE